MEEEQFHKKVDHGYNTSASVDKELQDAEGSFTRPEYFGLLESFKSLDLKSVKSLLSNIDSISPAFLQKAVPMLSKVDPELAANLSTGKGLAFMKLVSTMFTQNKFRLSQLDPLVNDEKSKKKLEEIKINYQNGGVEAVSIEDMFSVISNIDIGIGLEKSKPFIKMLQEAFQARQFTLEMMKSALSEYQRQIPPEPESKSFLEYD
jgi:hypothetical protein